MIPSNLETARLHLRPFSSDDSAAVLAYWKSDPGWEKFNASVPANFTASDAARFVAEMVQRDRHDRPHWAIIHDATVVGVVSLTFEQDHRIAVIGYGVHAKLRGRGLTVEATSKVIGEAFSGVPELTRLRAHTNPENAPSMRVLEKLGFTLEGILRKNQFSKGRLTDEAVFGLLRTQ